MPQLIFLPHEKLCPEGLIIEANSGDSILDIALKNGLLIEHACEKSCACSTCHVIIREGFNSLAEASEEEEEELDQAWGLEMNSRLSCQSIVKDKNLVIEIPKYNVNLV